MKPELLPLRHDHKGDDMERPSFGRQNLNNTSLGVLSCNAPTPAGEGPRRARDDRGRSRDERRP